MLKNQVRDIFTARIKQLISQYEGSKTIIHPSTVGTMREAYLKSFLREVLPPKFYPVSGFICDKKGTITPQLDMLFIDHSELPTISLVSDTVIVPYEIALLTAEVKSKINNDTIKQIRKQREVIGKMESEFLIGTSDSNTTDTPPRNRGNTIGTFIIAFDTDVAENKLKDWVTKDMGDPAGICVLNKSSRILAIFREIFNNKVVTYKSTSEEDYDPLLTFVGAIYRWLYYLLIANSTMTDQEKERYWNTHATWLWEGYFSNHTNGLVHDLLKHH